MTVWWFTGLSGSGKTTTANALKAYYDSIGEKCIILDGDILRKGLCGDLGFSLEDREENLRRVSHVARMFRDEGYHVICSFVSPTEDGRRMANRIIGIIQLVWFSTPLEECEKRDAKGLYRKAREGKIENFTGIGQEYERPEYANFIFDTSKMSTDDIVNVMVCARVGRDLPGIV
jgi:adenylyl-sulfate kinase